MSKRPRGDDEGEDTVGAALSTPVVKSRSNEALEAALDNIIPDLVRSTTRLVAGFHRKTLEADLIEYLLRQCREVILAEPMLVRVPAPVNICGDVHGQLHDLRVVLSLGAPPQNRYLFLGDYVDRGKLGIECMCILLYYKYRYPTQMYLLRGNHETETLTRQYGFWDECKRRYSPQLFKQFVNLFNVLPVAALVEERALCMHGGLSRELKSFDDIDRLERPYSVPDAGLVCDLLWADPEEGLMGWGESERGVSFTFGADIVQRMTDSLDLDLIVRAHQVMDQGYSFFAGRRLVTVFSASNYCGEFTNWGAMLQMDGELRCKFHIFKPDYCNPNLKA